MALFDREESRQLLMVAKWYLATFLAFIAFMVFVYFVDVRQACAEEYVYVKISQGVKIGDAPWGASNWKGDYPTAFALGYEWEARRWFSQVEGQHISNIADGPPFNRRDETWLDVVWFTVGYRFK